MTFRLKKKIKSKNFIMYLVFGLVFVSAILLSQLSNSIHVKIFSPLLVVVCFIFLRSLIQLRENPKKSSDELVNKIQLQVFSNSLLSTIGFLSVFALLQTIFKFNIEPIEVITIIIIWVNLTLIVLPTIIRKKYQ